MTVHNRMASVPVLNKSPPNDLYRRLLPAVLFLLTFVTVTTGDTVVVGAQQFRLNVSRDYELASLPQDSKYLIRYVRQLHLTPKQTAAVGGQPPTTRSVQELEKVFGQDYVGTFLEVSPGGGRSPTAARLEAAGWSGTAARAAPQDYLARPARAALHACLSPTEHPREIEYQSGNSPFSSRVLCLPLYSMLAAADCSVNARGGPDCPGATCRPGAMDCNGVNCDRGGDCTGAGCTQGGACSGTGCNRGGDCAWTECEQAGDCTGPNCDRGGDCTGAKCKRGGDCRGARCTRGGDCTGAACTRAGDCTGAGCKRGGDCTGDSCRRAGRCMGTDCTRQGICVGGSCQRGGDFTGADCTREGDCTGAGVKYTPGGTDCTSASYVSLAGEELAPALTHVPFDKVHLKVIEIRSPEAATRKQITDFLLTKNYTVLASFDDSVMFKLND